MNNKEINKKDLIKLLLKCENKLLVKMFLAEMSMYNYDLTKLTMDYSLIFDQEINNEEEDNNKSIFIDTSDMEKWEKFYSLFDESWKKLRLLGVDWKEKEINEQ